MKLDTIDSTKLTREPNTCCARFHYLFSSFSLTIVDDHVIASVPKERVLEPFPLIEPISHSLIICLVRKDHGYPHLTRNAGGGDISRVVEPGISQHDLTHDRHYAEKFHKFLSTIKRSEVIRILLRQKAIVIKIVRRTSRAMQTREHKSTAKAHCNVVGFAKCERSRRWNRRRRGGALGTTCCRRLYLAASDEPTGGRGCDRRRSQRCWRSSHGMSEWWRNC
mmetsp:Transcript_16497/g.28302  ORF Transcript_16497/g.28302 Transcript_16497/m.28302 type:complete len:222 (+) Transcript_16497:1131-1796(+)